MTHRTTETGNLAAAAALLFALAPSVMAQELDKATIERLRRDQDEILRKAERLQKLMTRLKVRYCLLYTSDAADE